MPLVHSPLRYPGGKSCLYPLISMFLRENGLKCPHYAEPYAGGASLALSLLFGGQVSDIHLNDVDHGIWAFWHVVLEETDKFIDLIRSTPVNVEEWKSQKLIYKAADISNPLELGFATFFLNRTNRSGIIGTGGIIGGLQQDGNYKIDCRFNREELIRRIQRIKKYKSRIHLTKLDAVDFIDNKSLNLPKKTFFAIDPPYFSKGSSLYTSFYSHSDHELVAKSIIALKRPWILTYDAVPQIESLYKDCQQFLFDIKYSVQTKRVGTELLIAPPSMQIPSQVREHVLSKLLESVTA